LNYTPQLPAPFDAAVVKSLYLSDHIARNFLWVISRLCDLSSFCDKGGAKLKRDVREFVRL
jgi:hypothetical protein